MEEQYACGRKRKPNQLITDPSTRRVGDGANKKHAAAQRGKKWKEDIRDKEKIFQNLVCLCSI